jgi:hypothetical protein
MAIEAGPGAFVWVFCEIPFVKLIVRVSTAGVGITIIDIDGTIAIDVFFRIADSIVVKVPASLPVSSISSIGSIGAISARGSRGTIVAFAA